MLFGMRILGIDPGLATIGIGVIDANSAQDMNVVDWLTITTKPSSDTPGRLQEIHEDMGKLLEDMKPELAVVERLFFAKNETTAMNVSQARGCILLSLSEHHIPLIEPTPLQLKSAITGDGKASKNQVRDMIMHMLRLQIAPTPDDAADALALAAFGALQLHTLPLIAAQHSRA
jgi:crossover junction endodeoxyribonuclease RuvC